MNTMVDSTLRFATRGLTGKREKDVVFLRKQIEAYRFDTRVCDRLERILRGLTIPAPNTAAA